MTEADYQRSRTISKLLADAVKYLQRFPDRTVTVMLSNGISLTGRDIDGRGDVASLMVNTSGSGEYFNIPISEIVAVAHGGIVVLTESEIRSAVENRYPDEFVRVSSLVAEIIDLYKRNTSKHSYENFTDDALRKIVVERMLATPGLTNDDRLARHPYEIHKEIERLERISFLEKSSEILA